MSDIAQDLGGVVRLLEKATPGEWFARRGYRYMHVRAKGDKFGDHYIMEARQRGTVRLDDDAKAIAAAINFMRTHSAEIAGALRDAERYRWLRNMANFGRRTDPQVCMVDCLTGDFTMLHAEQVDTAIDSAMQQGGGGGEAAA